MKRQLFESSGIFHVLGQGWYVETPVGNKGPFVLREHAERYLAALKALVDLGGELTAEQWGYIHRKVIVHSRYIGPDRRVNHRRKTYDRRARIRYEEWKRTRRSDRERRKESNGE